MLDWERFMNEDFSPFYGPLIATSPTTTTLTLRSPFSDQIIRNKEARVLKDSEGEVVIMYSFVDQNTIVITTNESTFVEILTRLTAQRI